MTDKNANTEIRKEFCPNCEAETPCTHEAELYVCDICGEDFAKYIVSMDGGDRYHYTAHDIGYRDLERKVKALEADCSISNRELLILSVELARRDEIIARLKEDAERLATRAVYWDDYGKEYECIHLECSGHSENILFDHAPDCPITLHRALMKELE